ncbi:MAG: calcium/proton exchanger [Candidatus Eremiobacterota bacterium]
MGTFFKSLPKLSYLLFVFGPLTIGMAVSGQKGTAVFIVACLAILGSVTLIGKAVEEVSLYVGPLWGGLINATFANVTELIIAMTALKKGIEYYEVVRASITGSILGNLLLVLGAAMVYGGLRFPQQRFTRTGATVNLGMLWVVLIILMVPSMVHYAYSADPKLSSAMAESIVVKASIGGALVLLGIYFLSLVFSLRTHRSVLMPDGAHSHHEEEPAWSKLLAVVVLLGTTLVVAQLSEIFVESLEFMLEVQKAEISHLFVGVVIVAVVGNASEGMVAVWVARENKMELSYQIAMGSCLQVALLVAPLLVLASLVVNPGQPMTLVFNIFELAALGSAVAIASASLQDGECNWLEGAMFLAVYLFFAMVFWFHP